MIKLDYHSRVPIYKQIEDSIVELILLGVYGQDAQLPSVRSLAVELGINPNTIQKAYQELETVGIISSVTGKGSFVRGVESARQIQRGKAIQSLSFAIREARTAGIQKEEAMELVSKEYEVTEQ
ncbi:MAG: GntR family transcriptional regulator [Angelakisella sp.]|nr:GntR family transcriptional regulator [Angelakisella sp.]